MVQFSYLDHALTLMATQPPQVRRLNQLKKTATPKVTKVVAISEATTAYLLGIAYAGNLCGNIKRTSNRSFADTAQSNLNDNIKIVAEKQRNTDSVHLKDPNSDETHFLRFVGSGPNGRCEKSFEIVHARYEKRIKSFFLKHINDGPRADDLTQDVFIRIVRAADRFDFNKKFATWCYTIANNVKKNWFRTCSRNHTVHFSEIEGNNTEDPSRAFEAVCTRRSPENDTYSSEIHNGLLDALAQLPEENRKPFILRQIDGLSYEEVSQQLGVPIGTVKSRTHKARQDIRELLGAHFREKAMM
jgi:RNA polymerase sigma-70 factor, ECF subfamily